MLSFLDELEQEVGSQPGCKTCRWLSQQDPDVVADFNDWVDSGKPLTAVARAMTKRGFSVTEASVRRHVERHHNGIQ